MTRIASRLRDVGDVLLAQAELVRARWALRRVRPGQLVAAGGGVAATVPEPGAPPGATGDLTRAERWARAVSRAARWGPVDAACLARSLALHRMLRRRGIGGSRVRIGVRSGPDGFEAHAWVTLGATVVGDDPAFVARFRELPEVAVRELR